MLPYLPGPVREPAAVMARPAAGSLFFAWAWGVCCGLALAVLVFWVFEGR